MNGADFLQLDPNAAPHGARMAWLTEQLRAGIADGRLAQGVRIPSSRVLAEELSMSRGTVVEAYQRLMEEGLVVSNRGGGTVVANVIPASATTPSNKRVVDRGHAGGHAIDISSGMPDLSAFPRAAWSRAERKVLSTATGRELGYADPQGVPALRDALAGWLARSRGVVAEPDQIIVTAGVTGALSLLAQVLRDHGVTTCAVEDPGADGNRRILDYWMDDLVPVPVDDEGLRVSALAQTSAQAVVATPAHQFPTGVVLSPERRRALVAWAGRTNGIVIEDDYDAEYRYDRAPVRAVQGLSPERVVHVSSLSKVLAPALRVGWMVAPAHLRDELAKKRWATDLGSPALVQLTLTELIETGALERHLRTLRKKHRERRDAAVEAIARYLPGCRIEGIAAGLHLVVILPKNFDDKAVAERARDEGISVHPLSQHRFTPGAPGLVIGYGPHPVPILEQALRSLGRVVTRYSK